MHSLHDGLLMNLICLLMLQILHSLLAGGIANEKRDLPLDLSMVSSPSTVSSPCNASKIPLNLFSLHLAALVGLEL